jgi:hypothetical protein
MVIKMVNYKAIEQRRKAWDASHPAIFANAGGSRGLNERLRFYVRINKHEEDSPEVIRKLETIDGVVAEVVQEIRKRNDEDNEIENDQPDPELVRKQEGRALKKELQKTIDRRSDTLILLSKEDMESEAEIAGNPARAYENTSGQELLRNVDKELKSVFQRNSRPRVEKDTLSEEIEHREHEPKGDASTAMSDLTEEMEKAVERLLPADNYILANQIRVYQRGKKNVRD